MSVHPPTDVRFAIVPEHVLLEVGPLEVAVYANLARYADNDTGRCWPSLSTLADRIGRSEDTVRRCLKVLAAAGFILVHRRPGTSNAYTVKRMPPTTPRTGATPGTDARTTPRTGATPPPALVPGELDQGTRPPELDQDQIALRARNEHWDALVEVFGKPAKGGQSLFGRLTKQVSEHPVEEIIRRVETYARAFPEMPLTVAALDKHWAWLGSPAGRDAAKGRRERKQRAAKPVYRRSEA